MDTGSKVLLPVAGRPIIDYTLEAFREVDVTDLLIVIGYKGDAVREHVGDGSDRGLRIQYVFNPYYEHGNALSLYAARPLMNRDPFLLAMAGPCDLPGAADTDAGDTGADQRACGGFHDLRSPYGGEYPGNGG